MEDETQEPTLFNVMLGCSVQARAICGGTCLHSTTGAGRNFLIGTFHSAAGGWRRAKDSTSGQLCRV